MVMQAKLERRRRRHGEGSDRADSSTPNQNPDSQGAEAGRLQSIPPPSEPVMTNDVKPGSYKAVPNDPALTPVPSRSETAGNRPTPYDSNPLNGHTDSRMQSPAIVEDKSNPTAQKGVYLNLICTLLITILQEDGRRVDEYLSSYAMNECLIVSVYGL